MSLKDILKNIKLQESSIKMVIKSLFMVTVGIFLLGSFQKEKGQTIPGLQIGDETRQLLSHVVLPGEDLWSIAEKYYGSGFEWTKIAQENDLTNPNVIDEGQTLKIPSTPNTSVLGSSPIEIEDIKEPDTGNIKEAIGSEIKIHTVRLGDNLWKIAETYYESGYNWVDIAKENNLDNPQELHEGQELRIPNIPANQVSVLGNSEVNKIDGDSYVVQKGDNLWEIAVRAYGDGYRWSEVAKKNALSNPGLIYPNQTIIIPR